jgi:hypothetical protein
MNYSSGLIAREVGLQHFQLILEKQNGAKLRDLGRQVIIDGKLRLGLKKEGYSLYLPESAYVEGTQCLNHTLLPIDGYWAHGLGLAPAWANFPFKPIYTSSSDGMEPPAFTDEQLQQFVKNFTEIGGAVTLNVGIFQEGHIGKLTLKQLQVMKENYKMWKH